MRWRDYYLEGPVLRPRKLQYPHAAKRGAAPSLLLWALVCSQCVTGWLLVSSYQLATPSKTTLEQCPDVEKRFSDISLVLRFLLDRVSNKNRLEISEPDLSFVSSRDSDVQVVTVTAPKANLRIGPSRAHSPLMTVAQGTRLAVETRQGEWFRVIAPNGQRTWISKDVLGPVA